VSEGIFTHLWPAGETSPAVAGFEIRLSVHPAIADDVLRAVVPIIVGAGCPFKVIANTALLELVCSRCSSGESAADFMTIYPPSRELFNDLTARIQRATHGIKSSCIPMPSAETRDRMPLTPDNPWPGLDSFLPNEHAYFFGRENEQLELVQRLERGVVTVVLGQPGVGKSSLLRAGLKPLFDRMRLEPVYLRLQCAGAEPPVQQVRDAINRVLRERQIDGAPFGEGQTLWEYFYLQNSRWVAFDRILLLPVLIFDQFEDVLAFDATDPAAGGHVEALWTQIANLAGNRVRETISPPNRPSSDSGTKRHWFKVVICLRQDHLPQLLARGGQIPSITQNHFFLKPFNGWQALQAVLGPGRRLFDPANPDSLAETIVRRLGRETPPSSARSPAPGGAIEPLDKLRIEPPLLSFFCQQLNETRKRPPQGQPGAGLITAELVDASAGRILEDFFQRGDKARNAAPAAQSHSTDQEERRPPEEKELPAQKSEPPRQAPFLARAGDPVAGPLQYLTLGLGLLLIIIVAVILVTSLKELQRQQAEVELQQFISNLAAAKKTFRSANNKLSLAESSLALKESNLLALAQQTREQELETRDAKEQNSRLAGEQTDFRSRITQLNREKAQAESRLAQWSNLLYDLTNQIANLNRQKEDLEARNDAGLWNPSAPWLASSKLSDEYQEPDLENFPGELPATLAPDPAPSSPRNVTVLLVHGQCLGSDDGTNFHRLRLHHVLGEGAIIRTGEKSWGDFFIRRAGTTVRLAPESQMKIAKLSEGSQNGVPVTETVLQLCNGRIFTVVRALVPGNTLEISDAAGRSVIEGGGLGCYMITAPGPDSADKLSVTPLRTFSRKGTTVIAPGQEYSAKDGAALSLGASRWERVLIQLDELEAETDQAIALPEPPPSPIKNQ
jgi:hypothetical protein